MQTRAIVGSLLGTAMGDAIGLPYEGLSRRRAARMFGPPDRHRLLFGYGMVSDDTEHACMTAQALLASGGDVERFRRQLSHRLRYWLLMLPAGVGFATGRAIIRLWLGWNPARSGVYSAGNRPAMRAPLLGAAIADTAQLRAFVTASTRLTHTDPKADHGAYAVALAAHLAARHGEVDAHVFLADLERDLGDEAGELLALLHAMAKAVKSGRSTPAYAASIGLDVGVSGYMYHTVPVALHAWLSHQRDFRGAVMEMVSCGGDTDSTAAIVGGIVGAAHGRAGIPDAWLNGLAEWPRSVGWMESLAERLAQSNTSGLPVFEPRILFTPVRNLIFLVIVLLHGFRRLLPPY